MKEDLILHGIRIGQYEVNADTVIENIQKECIDKGMNYVAFSTGKVTDQNYYLQWAKFLRDNGVYFTFTEPLAMTEETALKMKEIAGAYYIGNVAAEIGSHYGCVASGYHGGTHVNHVDNMESGKQALINHVRAGLDAMSFHGKIPATVVEATGLLPYVVSQNVVIPILETMCGNPEIMIPMLRANAKVIQSDRWATYIAHEWYGGTRALDPLKMHRLKMIYNYAYLSGSNMFVLESGDICLYAHDTHPENGAEGACSPFDTIYHYDHPVCQEYRAVLKEFADFLKTDPRPAGGPKVKFAFVQGNLDGYSPWRAGSSIWNCYNNKDFGYGAPEFVWRIFDEITNKRAWHDVHNFGKNDLSGAPAYGQYDVVPATASYEMLSKYDYLIFTGWNTMTEEIYDTLKQYVYNGGILFMTAAHLNTSILRNGERKLIHNGNVSDLFGCRLNAEEPLNLNHGFKFQESILPGILYPADMFFDPLMSEGYANYAKVTLQGASATGKLSNNFVDENPDAMPVWLTENQYGDGYAILMTTLDYPSGSTYSAYKTVVRELLTASHRAADVKVYGGDKLRFAVYEGNRVYLLNTDFDCQTHAVIDYGFLQKSVTLEPRELRVIEAPNRERVSE